MVPSLPFWAERLRDVIRWLAKASVCTEVSEMATSGDDSSAEIDSSSRSSSELSLHYSSSPFDEHSVSPESGAETEEGHAIEPYMYEPDCDDEEESPTHSEDEFGTHRLDNNDWCAFSL